MRLNRISHIVILAALALSLGACKNFGKKKSATAGSDGDFVNGTPLPERQEGVSFTSDNVDKKQFSPVHFGFDSCAVESGEQGKIDTVAEFLKSNQNTIILAGFTDERGTPHSHTGTGQPIHRQTLTSPYTQQPIHTTWALVSPFTHRHQRAHQHRH